jgi:hypothetical protein
MTNAKSLSTNPTRIIKRSSCKPISPSAKGELTYNIGHNDQPKALIIRIIANTGGGFFSNEWIALDDILACIEEQPTDAPFKALIFRQLYVLSRSSNNHGFLAAALRAEGILLPVEKAVYSHTLGDVAAFTKAMAKPIKENVSLEDTVAIHNAEMEARRQAMAEKIQKVHSGASKAKSTKGK